MDWHQGRGVAWWKLVGGTVLIALWALWYFGSEVGGWVVKKFDRSTSLVTAPATPARTSVPTATAVDTKRPTAPPPAAPAASTPSGPSGPTLKEVMDEVRDLQVAVGELKDCACPKKPAPKKVVAKSKPKPKPAPVVASAPPIRQAVPQPAPQAPATAPAPRPTLFTTNECPSGYTLVANVWSLSSLPPAMRAEAEKLMGAAEARMSGQATDMKAYQGSRFSRALGARLRGEVRVRAPIAMDVELHTIDAQTAKRVQSLGAMRVTGGVGSYKFPFDPRTTVTDVIFPPHVRSPAMSGGEARIRVFGNEIRECTNHVHAAVS